MIGKYTDRRKNVKTGIYCPPCIYRTYMDCLRQAGLNEEEMVKEAKWFCAAIANMDENLPSACNHVYRDRLWEIAGGDCYAEVKKVDNLRMLEVSEEIAERIASAEDPLTMGVRYAIAGNIIDPTAHYDEPLEAVLAAAAARTLAVDDIEVLRKALNKAEKILYVTDNAGEVVMDRVFLEMLIAQGFVSADQVTVAVRSTPFANDAMLEDAEFVGLTELVKVIGTGARDATLYKPDLSEEFMGHYREADLVITKGMGNFESACEYTDKTICMLLMTKCIPVAQRLETELGAFVCKVINKELLGL